MINEKDYKEYNELMLFVDTHLSIINEEFRLIKDLYKAYKFPYTQEEMEKLFAQLKDML